MNPKKLLRLAAKVSRLKLDDRNYFLGAVGLRSDDVLVFAANGAPKYPEPKHHAEYRLSRKLGRNSIVYVARTLANGMWSNGNPCTNCRARLANVGCRKVFYTISAGEYGVLEL